MSIDDVLESIIKIGSTCGAAEKAEQMVRQLNAKIETIKKQMENLPRHRVLVCIERDIVSGSFEPVYIAGADGFYSKMIELAGGANAYAGRIKFPKVGLEGIIAMNPEVIIDIVSDIEGRRLDEDQIRRQWKKLADVEAVKKTRFIFSAKIILRFRVRGLF